MGDESRIPIEARVTEEPDEVGSRTAPTRVLRQPRRPGRLAAALAVAAVVAGGVGLALRDGGGSAEPNPDEPPETTVAPTDPERVPAAQAYSRAALDFEGAGSFAYRGVVRAAEGNPFLPPGWPGGEVTVEGAAVLPAFAGRETLVDAAGRAFEAVATSGGAWSRSAPRPEGLAAAPWSQLRSPPPHVLDAPTPDVSALRTSTYNSVGELGLTVALAARSAGERRSDHPDAAGRRAVRATLPSDAVEEPWAAADVVLTLDDRGEVARIAVEPEPGRPPFEVELDIVAVGGPQTVVPPEIGQAAHRGVPLDAVAAAGIEAVELGQVPSGWVLSQAWAFDLAPQCTALSLGYVNAVTSGGAPGSLRLTMTTEACAPVLNAVTVVSRPEPLAVGPFTGTIGEQGASTTGWLSDGVTAVTFDTDLPAEDVTALLSSLRPFDTRSEPDPVDGITSS